MLTKKVQLHLNIVVLACDGRCDKAWGMNVRPMRDEEQRLYATDDELGTAPPSPIREGGDSRPSDTALSDADAHLMNKWCARECERCRLLSLDADEKAVPEMLPDLSSPTDQSPRVRTRHERYEALATQFIQHLKDKDVSEKKREAFWKLYAAYQKHRSNRPPPPGAP